MEIQLFPRFYGILYIEVFLATIYTVLTQVDIIFINIQKIFAVLGKSNPVWQI